MARLALSITSGTAPALRGRAVIACSAPVLRGGAVIAWVALVAAVGCSNTGTPCNKRGAIEACSCSDGAKGARVCLPERVWDKCDCSAGSDVDAGRASGAGSGGMVGTSGAGGKTSSAGAGGNGGGGGAGQVAPTPMGDKDAGHAPDAMAADGQTGGGGSGGDAGGMGGTGGMVAPTDNAYGTCADASECKVAGSNCNVVAGVPSLSDDSSVCQPPCQQASDCPKPAGSYEAALDCVEQQCAFDCAPTDLLGEDRSCPPGMTCTAQLDATSACMAQ